MGINPRYSLDAVLDRWANFDFKPVFQDVVAPVEIIQWVSQEDQRRLRAYSLLEAYCRNKSRIWLRSFVDEEGTLSGDIKNRREFGDANVIVETHLSSLLGDDWNVVTEGALGESEEIDEAGAKQQQQAFDQWIEKEKFPLKVIESETQSVKFGDSVYAVGWDDKKKRVRLNVYDPGFYFPVFDAEEGGSEDFPKEVVIAWEFCQEKENGEDETLVKRFWWWLDESSEGADDETCWYQAAIWTLEAAGKGFVGTPREWIQENVQLGVDFIPVVHVPNTVALQDHFGESCLAPVLQVLDDIQSVDTDTSAAAATTGTPPIAITGMGGDSSQTAYGPGTVLRTGDGNATLIDTSRSLDALIKLQEAQLQRLAVNSRTPESLLGRVKPNEVPSGIALTLSFTPHKGLVQKMRMVRDYKYRLLFKFVRRLTKLHESESEIKFPEEEYTTYLKFGSFLPADKQEAMTTIVQLLESHAISLETAVLMLVDAGYPIPDWITEIKRIEQRDYEAAQMIMTITGNPELAAQKLGIDPKDVAAFDDEEKRDQAEEDAEKAAKAKPPAPANA